MADEEADRNEKATPYKLELARKKGSVAKSADFTATAVLVAMVGTLYASGWDDFKEIVRLQLGLIKKIGQIDWSPDAVAALTGTLLMNVLQLLAPLFMAMAIAAIVANLFQTGPVFSMTPLTPDFERISPAAGFKRIFAMRTIYESIKSVIKLALLGAITYFSLLDVISGLLGLPALSPQFYPGILLALSSALLVKLLFAMVVLAVIDRSYVRWEFAKRMRMSRRDIRDESKNREGDPRIRARIRELRQEMTKRSKAIQKLPEADVLITNPTHIAIGLCYQHGAMTAPQVVAKGAGELATKMRQIAAQHHIPIVQNKALARTLFREVDVDGFVPEKWYPQMARIMVWVQTMRVVRQRVDNRS